MMRIGSSLPHFNSYYIIINRLTTHTHYSIIGNSLILKSASIKKRFRLEEFENKLLELARSTRQIVTDFCLAFIFILQKSTRFDLILHIVIVDLSITTGRSSTD